MVSHIFFTEILYFAPTTLRKSKQPANTRNKETEGRVTSPSGKDVIFVHLERNQSKKVQITQRNPKLFGSRN